MKILGIETSCDETAAAVVEDGTRLLSNIQSSSAFLHAKTGGVIPESAAREQVRSIIPVLERALFDASKKECPKKPSIVNWAKENIDMISVTAGPGLIGSLIVGVELAKSLAFVWNKPIVPVVHTLAHVYANWLSQPPYPKFPAVLLTVSGGHTNLFLMRGHGRFETLGETRDDTAGEAFDKIARYLQLGFPGGPAIQKAAEKGDSKAVDLPRPMLQSGDFDFSFSGLKTAVVRAIEKGKFKNEDIAAATQEAICQVLAEKTLAAIKKYKANSLLLAGGVAANTRLREMLEKTSPVQMFVPEIDLCTDNGAFVASYAFFNQNVFPWQKITAQANPEAAIEKYAKTFH